MDSNTREVMFSSSSKEGDHRTPKDLFNLLNEEFLFNIDLAASKENTLLPLFYSVENSAFTHSWENHRGFCNPPYGRIIRDWVNKAIEESHYSVTVMLVPARTDTKWFHLAAKSVDEIRFIEGRLSFEGELSTAPFPSLLLVWDKSIRFRSNNRSNSSQGYRWTSVRF